MMGLLGTDPCKHRIGKAPSAHQGRLSRHQHLLGTALAFAQPTSSLPASVSPCTLPLPVILSETKDLNPPAPHHIRPLSALGLGFFGRYLSLRMTHPISFLCHGQDKVDVPTR